MSNPRFQIPTPGDVRGTTKIMTNINYSSNPRTKAFANDSIKLAMAALSVVGFTMAAITHGSDLVGILFGNKQHQGHQGKQQYRGPRNPR